MVRRRNIVFILSHGSNCNKVMMALRASSGLYVLNSAQGTIRVQGRARPEGGAGHSGPARGSLTLVTKTFKMSAPDQLTGSRCSAPVGDTRSAAA